ncbi:MAG: PAS domain-containing protein, partial [Planctomycetota bacterium]
MKKVKAESDYAAELRQQAETLLKRGDNNIRDLSPEEMRNLVHELQTHQIELALQNEELHRAQDELNKSHEEYSDLYDFAPVGYATVSLKGLILKANLTLADMLGVERGKLLKQPFSKFIVDEDQDIYYKFCRELFKAKKYQSTELRIRKKDKNVSWVRIDSTVVEDDNSETGKFRSAIVDITGQKQAEKALRTNEAFTRNLVDCSFDCI